MRETLKRDKKDGEHLPCLPQEVILENILTRLPVKTLIAFGSVCKLWYNSIHHDTHFASSHFLQSLNDSHLIFYVFNVKDYLGNFFFYSYLFLNEEGDSNLKVDRFLQRKGTRKEELVGYCNGLVCLLRLRDGQPVIHIYHPSRREKLYIIHPHIEADILFYGFGFDWLSNEYKVVFIFIEYEEFKCKVFTSGTNSWREITCPPSFNRILKKTHSTDSESIAIHCDGALLWMSTRHLRHNLLSFDLHDETFQVIQLPTECVSMSTTTKKVLHLIELNGSPCVARLEKILQTDEDNSISCKVHLYILKDRVNQVWIKETTFDLLSSDLSCPCLYNTNTTRIMSFSGWVLLYWFNGKYIQFYDLHMKHLNVVDLSLDDDKSFDGKRLSKAKLHEMDYQLNSHIENLISLQTFLPEGDHRSVDDRVAVDAWQDMLNHGGGLVYARQNSSRLYIFKVVMEDRDKPMFTRLRSVEGKVVAGVELSHMDGVELWWKLAEDYGNKQPSTTSENADQQPWLVVWNLRPNTLEDLNDHTV